MATRRALANRRKALGDKHSAVAIDLNNLGVLLAKQGEFAAARQAYEEALAFAREAPVENRFFTAVTLNHLGALFNNQADYPAARRHYEQALAALAKDSEKYSSTIAMTLHNLGGVCRDEADYAAARDYYERALAVWEKMPPSSNLAQTLNNLGVVWDNLGNHAAAWRYHERALAIRKKLRGDEHPDVAESLNGLGNILQEQGDYSGARGYYERSLAIRKKIHGDNHPDTASAFHNLALLLQIQGDDLNARAYHEQALATYEKIYGPEHPTVAASLHHLGIVLKDQGDRAGARTNLDRALAIKKKALGENHPSTGLTFESLGSLHFDLGDFAAARKSYERALSIHSKALGNDHPALGPSLTNLGSLLSNLGEFDTARTYLERALAIRRKAFGEDHHEVAVVYSNLGHLFLRQEDVAGTRRMREQALAIQRRVLDLAAVALSERQQIALNNQSRVFLDEYLSLPTQAGLTPAEVYNELLGWKGEISFRQHQLRSLRQDPQFAPRMAELQAVTNRLANLASATADPKKAAEHGRLLSDLTRRKEDLEIELSRRGEQFLKERQIARINSERLRAALPKDLALIDFIEYRHLQKLPGKDLTAMRRLTAFVSHSDAPVFRIDLGPVDDVKKAVEAWRGWVMKRQSASGEANDPGQALRRLVWHPLTPHLRGAKTVLISPDGATAQIPFGALPGEKADTYLVEEIALAVVPLPRVLPALLAKSPPERPASLMLVGDVDYGAQPGRHGDSTVALAAAREHQKPFQYAALEGAGKEVVALRKAFERRFPGGDVRLLDKASATESAVREHASRHRWLHVATHGFFAPVAMKSASESKTSSLVGDFDKAAVVGYNPGLLSGLVFAGANRPPQLGEDDGILTALEVGELDLSKVELAVLSACETGLGKVAGGEGILGLQRSFQIAGAGTVVASMWSVPDDPTRVLMERVYDNLWDKKMTKLAALTEAQRWMLREGRDHPDIARGATRDEEANVLPRTMTNRLPPYYWAAFVLSGDWR